MDLVRPHKTKRSITEAKSNGEALVFVLLGRNIISHTAAACRKKEGVSLVRNVAGVPS